MSTIVSFLIVTRSNVTHARFLEARAGLSAVMRSCRELIQYAITFTRYDTSDAAKKWRYDLCKKTITLLRSVVSVVQFESALDGDDVWKNPSLSDAETAQLKEIAKNDHIRIPMILTMFVRTSISSHEKNEIGADGKAMENLHVNRELKLYGFVSSFVESYHVLSRLIDTPFPFPLAQMNRTFVFIWVYTLPWVLYEDGIRFPYLCFTAFFISFAFMGLEYVSIELDDPFGEDPNDFDVLRLADVVFHDIHCYLKDIDGKEQADKLKKYFEVTDEDRKDKDKDEDFAHEKTPLVPECKRRPSFAFGDDVSSVRHRRCMSLAINDDINNHLESSRSIGGSSIRELTLVEQDEESVVERL